MPEGSAVGTITWIGHSTVLIELDGVRLLTDPVLRGRLAQLRRVPSASAAPPRDVDAVLVSHAHFDHLDPPSLTRLGRNQRVIVPRGVGRVLRRKGFGRVEEVAAGEEVKVGPVLVRATYAEHSGHRFGALHILGGAGPPALGYVVTGRRQLYFAGDSDLFDGMANLAPGLDVALLPVWGWGPSIGPGHLDPLRAALALRLLQPRVAVPIHWGSLFSLWPPWSPRPSSEPALAFRRHAREVAPAVDVRVLPPGGSLGL